jgi:hypothetical protein
MKSSGSARKPDIKFHEIRTFEGKQDKGFEELCVQLFPLLSSESLLQIDRIEGRGGDGGVEAIALTASNQYIGLQSKFFTKLDASQLRQIDESVKTAIQKHPELTRYIVCVPLDRTPGQMEKWNRLVLAWKALSSTLSVEWTGSSELTGLLIKPEASIFLTYWFGCPDFSLDWVSEQTVLGIAQLHNRYTPALHQATSAQVTLSFIAGSKHAVSAHRTTCSKLVIAWRKVLEQLSIELARLKTPISSEKLQLTYQRMLADLHDGDLLKQGEALLESLNAISVQADALVNVLFPRDSTGEYDRKAHRQFCSASGVDATTESTLELHAEVGQFVAAHRSPVWILKGEAGSGKSHLMASLAQANLVQGRPCLLVVGERFATQEVLAQQIPSLVNWSWSLRELFECLSVQASTTGGTALLMIDAINESPARGLWKREFSQLVGLNQEYPNVRILVSCRSDCVDASIPSKILEKSTVIEHHGFDLQFYDAVKAYFDGYAVTSAQFPTLNGEFQNPLFLKTLCEAYRGRALPLGPVSFVKVLADWESRIAENIETLIDCPRRATQRAVKAIVEAMATTASRRLDAGEVEAICLQYFPVPEASRSLYRHLNSEGLLQEVESLGGTQVRLQYERFSDVRVAQAALQGFQTKKEWLAHWQSNLLPSITNRGRLDSMAAPQLFAYALLLPEAVGVELVSCPIASHISDEWARSEAKEMLWSAWLDALSWRAITPGDAQVVRLFRLWAKSQHRPHEVWGKLFQFSCIPAHPLNADFLHRHLIKQLLPVRESNWTVPLALESPNDLSNGTLAPFFHWTDASAGRVSEEQSRLAVTVLLWVTSSPNRELRDQAADIAIRVLAASRSGAICVKLLENFWETNDPYVKERLLAVMCGVLPHIASAGAKQISEFVLKHFWQKCDVAPHILQRDYAEFIVRHACETGALSVTCLNFLKREINKPKPKVWTEDQVQQYAAIAGYGRIASSLVPEEMGHYGDFGRYVMGSAVHHFEDDDRADVNTRGLGRGNREHDARFARRYIWQRIVELGWTPARFSEFEKSLGYRGRGRDEKKIERISKKYQWIGLHEYLGLLADSLLFRLWRGDSRPLCGAWELSVRDYDPSHAMGASGIASDAGDYAPSWWNIQNPILPLESVQQKQKWVGSDFLSFEPYLTVNHDGKNWIVLNAHLNFDEELGFGVEQFRSAQMSQWVDVRAFLIPKTDLAKKLKVLRGIDFFGDGCDIPEAHGCWALEYPWHPVFAEVDESCRLNETWVSGRMQKFFLPCCEISNDSKHVQLPAPTLHKELGEVLGEKLSAPRLVQSGSMEICGQDGRCVFLGSTTGGRVLVVDQTAISKYVVKKDCALVWAVLSEKSAWNGSAHVGGLARQSAVYVMDDDGSISGGLTFNKNEPPEKFIHQ